MSRVFAVLASTLMAALGSRAAPGQDCGSAYIQSSPSIVSYAGSASIAVSFVASPDGTVRASDAGTGASLWEFRPPEAQAASAERGISHALITPLRILRFDANGDGAINAGEGDRVWLYFGLRRAGPFYYALDVSEPAQARVLWKRSSDSLPGLAEAWSPPTLARIRVSGASQNGEALVLVAGGGLPAQVSSGDGGPADEVAEASGDALFIIDAATGELLWRASGTASTAPAQFRSARMTNPFAARVTAVDVDADGFTDRLYAVDLAGQVFRFDIWNGRPAANLVTGGVIADLSVPVGNESATAGRARFFNAPDAALILSRTAQPYYNLALGSGDMSFANATSAQDRFYTVRDRTPFLRMSQSDFDGMIPIVPADLVNLTVDAAARVPPDAKGWRIDLDALAGGYGERVLAESLTAEGVVLFTTFIAKSSSNVPPDAAASTDDGCDLSGTTRVYAVRVETGSAALDLNDDGAVTDADRSISLETPGPPAGLSMRLPAPDGTGNGPSVPIPGIPPAPGHDPGPTDDQGARCFVGERALSTCVELDALRRTFWYRATVD